MDELDSSRSRPGFADFVADPHLSRTEDTPRGSILNQVALCPSGRGGSTPKVPLFRVPTRQLMRAITELNFRLRNDTGCSIFIVPLWSSPRGFSPMADTTELVPELLEAGVHFGHQTKRWNPKMKPFIFEQRNQIYIINLDETVQQLHRATEFLQEVTRRGGKILFVGCKKQAQEAVKEAAKACGQFYFNQRSLGGTLTNIAPNPKNIGPPKNIQQI